jgi:hypothetical protein
LREDADFDVDRPLIIGDQRLHCVEPAHADRGIDLQLGAHPRRAVQNAIDERALGSEPHILDRKARLHRRDLSHRADLAPDFRRTAVDDPGFVEMDMRLD